MNNTIVNKLHLSRYRVSLWKIKLPKRSKDLEDITLLLNISQVDCLMTIFLMLHEIRDICFYMILKLIKEIKTFATTIIFIGSRHCYF